MLSGILKNIFNPDRGARKEDFSSGLSRLRSGQRRTSSRKILEAYGDSPWVHGPFGKLSLDFAEAPWTMYRAPGGGVDPVPRSIRKARPRRRHKSIRQALARNDLVEVDHYLLDVLEDGNPFMDGLTALTTLALTYLLDGEMVAVFERNDDGIIQHVYPIPTFWLIKMPTPEVPFYTINFPDVTMDVPEQDVFYTKDPDPRRPYGRGVGAGHALAEDFEADEMARKHIVSYFKNNSTPSLLIGVKNASQDQLDRAKEKWESENRGVLRGFATHFYSGELSAQQLSRTFRENQTIELRDFNQDSVMQILGMPPEIQGKLEDANTATIDAAEVLYTRRVLTPLCEKFRSSFQSIVDEEEFRHYLFGYHSVVPEDKEHNLSVFRGAPEAFKENEWRALAGRPPVEDGDRRYVETTYESNVAQDEDEQDEQSDGQDDEPEAGTGETESEDD